ncbi:hypothetical protein CC80DRAFT_493835 [Byssothecium circinans]|uniref:Uncharacterized protein n=1 Tax=Byssothecium circinans TaxID=147558 RepID=A0A6A5TPI7_9PLEO|nr:hypothetical protein CC80DRAFT_493835 [Byssothecium circinans]
MHQPSPRPGRLNLDMPFPSDPPDFLHGPAWWDQIPANVTAPGTQPPVPARFDTSMPDMPPLSRSQFPSNKSTSNLADLDLAQYRGFHDTTDLDTPTYDGFVHGGDLRPSSSPSQPSFPSLNPRPHHPLSPVHATAAPVDMSVDTTMSVCSSTSFSPAGA